MYAQGDDAAGEPALAKVPSDLQDYARRHPLRVAILALLAQRARSAGSLSAELPTKPGTPVLDYHLRALSTIGLVDVREEGGGSIYRLA